MNHETTTETETATEKKKPHGAAPEKKSGAKMTSTPATAKVDKAPLKYDFATTAPADGEISVKDIVFPDFDGRAAPGVLDDDFLASLRTHGVLQPVLCAPLTSGKVLLFAGRRRVRGAHEIGLKTVPVHFRVVDPKEIPEDMSLEQHLACLAITENCKRQEVSTWDLYVSMKRLVESGMTQSQIAKELGITSGSVSQHLAFDRLDKRTLTILRHAAHQKDAILSKARELAKLNEHPEVQAKIAEDCFSREKPWSFDELKDTVAITLTDIQEKERRAAERERAKATGTKAATAGEGGGTSDEAADEEVDPYKDVPIEFVGKTHARKFMSYLDLHVQKAKNMPESNAEERAKKAEKLAYELGRLDGAKQMAAIKALPKAVTG